jgi:hypothetical protein
MFRMPSQVSVLRPRVYVHHGARQLHHLHGRLALLATGQLQSRILQGVHKFLEAFVFEISSKSLGVHIAKTNASRTSGTPCTLAMTVLKYFLYGLFVNMLLGLEMQCNNNTHLGFAHPDTNTHLKRDISVAHCLIGFSPFPSWILRRL